MRGNPREETIPLLGLRGEQVYRLPTLRFSRPFPPQLGNGEQPTFLTRIRSRFPERYDCALGLARKSHDIRPGTENQPASRNGRKAFAQTPVPQKLQSPARSDWARQVSLILAG